MIKEFKKIQKVNGELYLPGDKSISHRAVMFSAMADGVSRISNLSNGEDVLSTQACFRQLGAEIWNEGEYTFVKGRGYKGFSKPEKELYAGNSGTTTRLIAGILAAQNFESVITGDDSLSKRPMKRIIVPITAMGGKLTAAEGGTLPLKIFPADALNAINYELPMASAQVKSAVLLAGLHLDETTTVTEPVPSRNHTEKMLNLKTAVIDGKNTVFVSKTNYPSAGEYLVPADISTAAFFIVLALLTDGSELILKNVSLNESRTGIIEVLKEMGGDIEVLKKDDAKGETYGDLLIKGSKLKNIHIRKEIIPNIIDEIPILTVAAIFAEGEFSIRNAEELRGKETDRINAMAGVLKELGIDCEEYEDGFSFSGEIKKVNPVFESYHDHRIAMSAAILSLILNNGGKVNNFECVNISNPNFLTQINQIVR